MAKRSANKKSPAKKAAKSPTSKSATSATKKSAKKATPKSKAGGKTAPEEEPAKKVASKKKAAPKKVVKKVAVAKKIPNLVKPVLNTTPPTNGSKVKAKKLPAPFLKKQQQKLLDLRDNLVDQMNGVTRDTLRGGGDDGSAFGMHQADAGSDSYDRDFALNLLSQEQDALEEIDEALRRIQMGTYGICEVSGEYIPQMRLEAMPFARLTVSCQEKIDHEQAMGYHRQPVTSLFGLDEKERISADDD